MRWTGRSRAVVRWRSLVVVTSMFLGTLLPCLGYGQEKVPLFVDEVRFRDFSPSLAGKMRSWGPALAAEVSGVLAGTIHYSPMTMENLESQLGKEERKASLACEDASCINRIVENFGCSQSVFSVVRSISRDKVQVTLFHTANGEGAGQTLPRYSTPGFEELASVLRQMTEELFNLAPAVSPRTIDSSGSTEASVRRRSRSARGSAGVEWVFSEPAGVYFARSETTISQYAECVVADVCEARHFALRRDYKKCNMGHSNRDDHPMNCVTWQGAMQFCAWVGGRLPTKREWMLEASDGGKRQYPWGGETATCERSVMADSEDGCGRESTWPVCSKQKGNSASGLCDMSGNVWEWTSTKESEGRVFLGGSWLDSSPDRLRSADLIGGPTVPKLGSDGFRCVRPLE